ncbi:MAG: A/G-specific adenine glycosylase, partial [Planctomycetota bacterium]
MPPTADDRAIALAIERWFRANARDLPWRPEPIDAPRDPYRALVSELMLQQTQVSRVIEKYDRFIERFPTAETLAAASEEDVLAEWSGLGYYRRARFLHAAARAIVHEHDGVFPVEPAQIRSLPGVGRYTAGAIASIVLGLREPILDGNVERVLLRVHAKPDPPKDKATQTWAWHKAEELVLASDHPGCLNEGLMELGATVCTPGTPGCPSCPLRDSCQAHARGLTDIIPLPKPRAKQAVRFVVCFLVTDGDGSVLIETRPVSGMWAGMVQPPSIEGDEEMDVLSCAHQLGIEPGERLGCFVHTTTHRRFSFEVHRGALAG